MQSTAMTWMSRAAAAALLAGLLAGCNTQRPLPIVWEKGNRAFEMSDYQTAETEYGEYLSRKPGEARVQLRMANTLLEQGRAAEAVEFAAIAHDLRPGEEEFVDTYARAMFEAGRNDDLFVFLRGFTADRGTVSDFLRLGQYASKLGDADTAEHSLLMAAKLDGGMSLRPQLALADFYAGISDYTNAKKRLRMALFIEPGNQAIHERLRLMGEIPGPSFAIQPDEFGGVTEPN